MKTITDIRNPESKVFWVGLVSEVVDMLKAQNKKFKDIPPGRLKIVFKAKWHTVNLREA